MRNPGLTRQQQFFWKCFPDEYLSHDAGRVKDWYPVNLLVFDGQRQFCTPQYDSFGTKVLQVIDSGPNLADGLTNALAASPRT